MSTEYPWRNALVVVAEQYSVKFTYIRSSTDDDFQGAFAPRVTCNDLQRMLDRDYSLTWWEEPSGYEAR